MLTENERVQSPDSHSSRFLDLASLVHSFLADFYFTRVFSRFHFIHMAMQQTVSRYMDRENRHMKSRWMAHASTVDTHRYSMSKMRKVVRRMRIENRKKNCYYDVDVEYEYYARNTMHSSIIGFLVSCGSSTSQIHIVLMHAHLYDETYYEMMQLQLPIPCIDCIVYTARDT